MTHHEIDQALAVIVLISATFLLIVDVVEQLGSHLALQVKWSLCWIIVRYFGITASVLLALDVFFI